MRSLSGRSAGPDLYLRHGHFAFGALALVLVLSLAGGGVSGCDGTGQVARACDPLQTVTLHVTLGQVVGIGRDQQGIIYVVDETAAGDQRLFVSQGALLLRHAVAGGGTISDEKGTLTSVTDGDAANPLNVEVHTDTRGHADAMGVFKGALTGKTFAIGTEGEVLQVLATDALAGLTLQNLPGAISVQHVATLADGRMLVVTLRDVDATEDDARVFFGTPPRLLERRVTPTAQPRSYTQLTFDINGQSAVATFTSPLNTGVRSMLTVGGQMLLLTEVQPPTPPTGATFLCL